VRSSASRLFRLIPLLYVQFNNSFICNVIRAIFFSAERSQTCIHWELVFFVAFGGFRVVSLGQDDRVSSAVIVIRLRAELHRQVLVASGAASLALFLPWCSTCASQHCRLFPRLFVSPKLGVRSSVSFTRRLPWSASVAPTIAPLDPSYGFVLSGIHRNGGLLWANAFAALRRLAPVPDFRWLDGKPHLLAVLLIPLLRLSATCPPRDSR